MTRTQTLNATTEMAGIRFPHLLTAQDILSNTPFDKSLIGNTLQLQLINRFIIDFTANRTNWERAFLDPNALNKTGSMSKVSVCPFGSHYESDKPTTRIILRHIQDHQDSVHPTSATLEVLATRFGILTEETPTFEHLKRKCLHTADRPVTEWNYKTVFTLPTCVPGISAEITVTKADVALNGFKLVIDRTKMGLQA